MKFTSIALALLGIVLGSAPAPSAGQEAGSGAPKQNLDLPFDAAGESEEEEEAPEIVVFYGQQYEGDGIFFSCDKSGSMNDGNKFKRLQQEVIKNVSQFSERVQFGIAFFDGKEHLFPPTGKPADASPAMKAAATAMVMSTTPGRGSCVKKGLIACLTFANQSSAKRKVIIHLADGFTTCPGFDNVQYGQETLSEVTQRNVARAQINAICIGPAGNVDENWMRQLASMNNGSYSRVVD